MSLFGAPNVEKMKGNHNVNGLIKALTYPKDADVRCAAARALGEIGDTLAVEPLIAGLEDSSEHMRIEVAKALGKIGASRAVNSLRIIALDKNHRFSPDEKTTAIHALGQIGAIAAAPLITAMKDSRTNDQRTEAKRSLVALGSAAVEPLIALLEYDGKVAPGMGTYQGVREAAVEALGEINDLRAVLPLATTLKEPYFLSTAVTKALHSLGDLAVDLLMDALKDQSSSMSEAAAEGLARIINPRVVLALITALNDARWNVRAAAARALGQIKDSSAVDPLIVALKDKHESVRSDVARALGKIKDSCAVESLILALKDDHESVRIDVIRALVMIGEPLAVQPLINTLKDSHETIPLVSAMLLSHFHDPTIKALSAMLQDGEPNVRRDGVDALELIGGFDAIRLLSQSLKDGSADVRSSAAQALGNIGESEVVGALEQALKDDHEDVRMYAAKALEDIKRKIIERKQAKEGEDADDWAYSHSH